jgi:hypothetical protein
MPSRWRDCYRGQGDVDLQAATLLSESHYLWSTNTLTSRLSGFFASKLMRNRSTEVDDETLPAFFRHPSFKGQAYRLDEPVFDTLSVIRALAEPRSTKILMVDAQSFAVEGQSLWATASNGNSYQADFSKLVMMAGEGNEQLLSAAGHDHPVMQRRPLKMVAMQGGLDDRVYAHCLGASVNPRITITSHFNTDGGIVWYLGGQLAEEGVSKTDSQLIADAKKELAVLIPWLDLAGKQFSVLAVNRAEIKKPGTTRPDSFSIEAIDPGYVAWPTKLALAPALADELLHRLQVSGTPQTSEKVPAFPPVRYADFPWNSCGWIT